MRNSRFGEEQIIAILREQEAGARTEEVCRRHGISTTTLYKWKARYGGLEVPEARRLKALEDMVIQTFSISLSSLSSLSAIRAPAPASCRAQNTLRAAQAKAGAVTLLERLASFWGTVRAMLSVGLAFSLARWLGGAGCCS